MLLSSKDQVSLEPDVNGQRTPASAKLAYRPVQYLGNKLRSLTAIGDAVSTLADQDDCVCDLFSGTSVVAQEFGRRGFPVCAVDSQTYAATFARATLGVTRSIGEALSIDRLVCDSALAGLGPWEAFAEEEEEALNESDYLRLQRLYAALPLWWRSPGGPAPTSPQQRLLLTTLLYSGTYFGVRQALELDELRRRIDESRNAGVLSTWQYDCALTALCSAASLAVHSAGKHFAQPLGAGDSHNIAFLKQRLLEDRRVSVISKFSEALMELNQLPHFKRGRQAVYCSTAEDYIADHREDIGLYYIDPPYTAQQYSRFYHFLETLVTWQWPNLLHDGQLTTGLYPTVRFKSAFSSKRKAPRAFENIITAARAEGAALAISYSQSSAKSDGNARMISMERLIEICQTQYGSQAVKCERLDHRYRQFNSHRLSNSDRNDSEVLILCKR